MSDTEGALSVDESETEEPKRARRVDAKSASAAPRRRGRPPKARHDTDVKDLPVDGFGSPFSDRVKVKPGFTVAWITEGDAGLYAGRPWSVLSWGDPRIVSHQGREGQKGQPVVYKELTAFIWRTEDAERVAAEDPQRRRMAQLKQSLYRKAAESGAVDVMGSPIRHVDRRGYVNVHQMR